MNNKKSGKETAKNSKNNNSKLKKSQINIDNNKIITNSIRQMILKFKTQKCSPERTLSILQNLPISIEKSKNNKKNKNQYEKQKISKTKRNISINSQNINNNIKNNINNFNNKQINYNPNNLNIDRIRIPINNNNHQSNNKNYLNIIPSNVYYQRSSLIKSTKDSPRNINNQKKLNQNILSLTKKDNNNEYSIGLSGINNNSNLNLNIKKNYTQYLNINMKLQQNKKKERQKTVDLKKNLSKENQIKVTIGLNKNNQNIKSKENKNKIIKESLNILPHQYKKNTILTNISNLTNINNINNIKLSGLIIPHNNFNNNNNIYNFLEKNSKTKIIHQFERAQDFLMKQNLTTTSSPNRFNDNIKNNFIKKNKKNEIRNFNLEINKEKYNKSKKIEKSKFILDNYIVSFNTNEKSYKKKYSNNNRTIKNTNSNNSFKKIQGIKKIKSSPESRINHKLFTGIITHNKKNFIVSNNNNSNINEFNNNRRYSGFLGKNILSFSLKNKSNEINNTHNKKGTILKIIDIKRSFANSKVTKSYSNNNNKNKGENIITQPNEINITKKKKNHQKYNTAQSCIHSFMGSRSQISFVPFIHINDIIKKEKYNIYNINDKKQKNKNINKYNYNNRSESNNEKKKSKNKNNEINDKDNKTNSCHNYENKNNNEYSNNIVNIIYNEKNKDIKIIKKIETTPFLFNIKEEEKKILINQGKYYLNESNKLIEYIKNYYKIYGEYPESQLSFYKFGRIIGKGAFGKVNLGLHILTGRIVAIKSFNKKNFKEKNSKDKIIQEINLMKNLNNPSIVKILDQFETQDYYLIIMENISGGDLLTFVKKRTKLSESMSKFIFKQLLQILKYIHNKGIAHRDIKLDNILIDLNNNIKLCDFGVGKIIKKNEKLKDQCGTPAYIAPEILKNEEYEGPPVDVWSSGVVLYTMINGTVPFKANNLIELNKKIIEGKFKENNKEFSKEIINLLHGLLEVDPKKRITVEEAINHPWFNNKDINHNINFNLEDNKQSFFTKAELILLSKNNIDYRNCNKEEMIESFTLENLYTDKFYENKNDLSKSIIFAPFNSSYINDEEKNFNIENKNNFEQDLQIYNNIILFEEKAKILNRQYELNNNGEIDHGILINHQNKSNNSNINKNKEKTYNNYELFEDEEKNFNEIKRIESSDNNKNQKIDSNRNIGNNITGLLTNSNTIPFDENVLKIMENYGYKKSDIQKYLYNNEINYCVATYYLLANLNE